ncbi:MAG: Doubled CXXCH motif protein [Candidatus Methanoperedens nitroreducens]|uniref:Doubled CXXCH motif protein n=1 Tax=Candidatus Methanoperedens nitratireducens TaxID=1392998 RepID=A0A0P8DYG1_9EURY|nr:MAG: Doubled CXXCH motif protein [Candidatus Methanoperedens sp. BLZ1]
MKKIPIILALLAYLIFLSPAGSALECMVCHSSNANEFPLINLSLFGVHADVNSTDGAGNITSGDCIACHYSANTLVFHSFPISTYSCEDCHINGTVPAAPRVSNHNRTGNVSVIASCADCHNKTSNLFRYSANASAAHYGRNASFGLAPGESYCAFCHQNSSTVYSDVMQNQDNSMRGNHTSGIINSTHPAGVPIARPATGLTGYTAQT